MSAPRLDVEAVRVAVDIAQIIGADVELKKTGAELVGLCPFHAERTPSFTVNAAKQVAHCHGCGWGGDVFAYEMKRTGQRFGPVLRDLARRVGIGADAGCNPRFAPRPRPVPEPLRRPPAGEPEAVWNAARSVYDDAEARAWIEARGLDVCKVTDRDLARAIPAEVALPTWARYRGAPWSWTGHRVIVRLWGATGQCESLHARSIRSDVAAGDKAAAAARAQLRGLVLACGLGAQVLAGRALDWWPRPWTIIIAEGEPDWLSWATRWGDAAEYAPAALGIVSGSWSPEIAARIPDGTTVILRTDCDDAGDRYADEIAATLEDRCNVLRRERTDEAAR